MLRIRRPGVGWMQNVSLDIILPAAYIPGDMALLPIWITSGSCFALIHPGTNDVPPAPSRSRAPAILSTMPRRRRCFACIYLRFISSRCRSTRTDRKFLNIGWKRYSNLIRKFTVLGERRALPGPTLFPLFFPCARSAMIHCFWWKRCYLARETVLSKIYLCERKVKNEFNR